MKAKARIRHTAWKSRAEGYYAGLLQISKAAGEIISWRYEPLTFKLGGDTRYTPDFMVQRLSGVLEFHEVKGFMRPAARVKVRVAATMYPEFTFFVAWSKGKDSFEIEEVTP